MLDDLLVPVLDLVEELADGLQLVLGGGDDAGDLRLHRHGALRGGGDLAEALVRLAYDAYALTQGLLGGDDAVAELAGAALHVADAGVHLARQHLDLLGQVLHLGGHHREALARRAGPGGLDGGVDGQDVGLVRDGDDLAHTLLNPLDGGLELGEDLRHLIVGVLHLHGGVPQSLHLTLGLGDGLGDLAAHLDKLLRRLVDVGEGGSQVLQLGLEVVRLLQHAGEGGPHKAQLPEGGDLLLHQLLLVLLQAARHMENGVEAALLPRLLRLLPVFSRKQHGRSLLHSKTTQVMDWLTKRLL